MRGCEALCQVQILTYCVLSNHFHILVRVPERPAHFDLPLEKVVELWGNAVGRHWRELHTAQLKEWAARGEYRLIDDWKRRTIARMFSLSEFFKLLKQRYTLFINRSTGRVGTLWESRFTSLIVEDQSARALRTIAAYIDLNPVRAGLVEDPAKYRWCGYAQAMRADGLALAGLTYVIFGNDLATTWRLTSRKISQAQLTKQKYQQSAAPRSVPARTQMRRRALRAVVLYRQMLGLLGRERRDPTSGAILRRGLSPEMAASLERETGVRREVLMHRVRHFTSGLIFGSREFIESWFADHRNVCTGQSRTHRTTGARPMGTKPLRGLYTFRALRKQRELQT
jgi:hypothetical protein